MANFYQILNILPTASSTEVQTAYAHERERLLTETARAGDDSDFSPQMERLDEAYATLSNAGSRSAYDRSLNPSGSIALVVAAQPHAIVVAPAVAGPSLQQPCPHCGTLNPIQATVCRQCNKQMANPCPNCGQNVILGQTVCPRCNTMIAEYGQRKFSEGLAVEQQVQERRLDSETRVETLEAIHHKRAIQGLFFWLVVAAICAAIGASALLAFYYFAQASLR